MIKFLVFNSKNQVVNDHYSTMILAFSARERGLPCQFSRSNIFLTKTATAKILPILIANDHIYYY